MEQWIGSGLGTRLWRYIIINIIIVPAYQELVHPTEQGWRPLLWFLRAAPRFEKITNVDP